MTELFLPEADEEFREAARYYENKCPGLGLTFITAVHKAISWIMENPMAATPVGSGIRSKVVGRFPYSVLYAIESDVLVIIAVAHQKRRPGYWRSRVEQSDTLRSGSSLKDGSRQIRQDGNMVLKNQKGITLIEMIVFIIVAAVALPVIISPVMTLLKDSTKPEKAVTANFLGQKILEVITANDFPTLTGTSSAPDSTEHSPPPPPSAVVTAINNKIGDLSPYSYSWDIYYINPVSPGYNLENEYTTAATKYVRIDVTVTDPYGRVFNYHSIVTKRKKDAVVE